MGRPGGLRRVVHDAGGWLVGEQQEIRVADHAYVEPVQSLDALTAALDEGSPRPGRQRWDGRVVRVPGLGDQGGHQPTVHETVVALGGIAALLEVRVHGAEQLHLAVGQ